MSTLIGIQMLTSLRLQHTTREACTNGLVLWNCELETESEHTPYLYTPSETSSSHPVPSGQMLLLERTPLVPPGTRGKMALRGSMKGGCLLGTEDLFVTWVTNYGYVPCWGSCSV